MIKYQIRYCDSKGHGYFKYFEVGSKKEAGAKAAEKATEHLIEEANKYKQPTGTFDAYNVFRQPSKPKRTIHVWEWDTEKKQLKKGGHRFKIAYCFIEYTYKGGGKKREEWYEPIIESK